MWWESYEAVSEQLRDGSRGKFRAALLALRDGAVVGAAKLDVRPDQPVEIEIGVLPAHRRRGIGTALAAGLHDRLPQHTSDVLQCEVLTEEGLAFARRWGIEPANVEDRQLLKLPIPDSALVELERPNSRISTHSWVGPCPERLVDDLARLTEQMEEDVPSGDLTRVVSPTDRKRVRYNEKRLDEEGYDLVRTIAQLDGKSVGYTTLFVPRNNPEIIVQDYTCPPRPRGRESAEDRQPASAGCRAVRRAIALGADISRPDEYRHARPQRGHRVPYRRQDLRVRRQGRSSSNLGPPACSKQQCDHRRTLTRTDDLETEGTASSWTPEQTLVSCRAHDPPARPTRHPRRIPPRGISSEA